MWVPLEGEVWVSYLLTQHQCPLQSSFYGVQRESAEPWGLALSPVPGYWRLPLLDPAHGPKLWFQEPVFCLPSPSPQPPPPGWSSFPQKPETWASPPCFFTMCILEQGPSPRWVSFSWGEMRELRAAKMAASWTCHQPGRRGWGVGVLLAHLFCLTGDV